MKLRRLLVLCAGCLVGCHTCPTENQASLYAGPTLSPAQVIAQINANNARIPTLWARQEFDGTIVDDKHESHSLSAYGVLLYRAPHELLIRDHKEIGEVFELGTTEQFYWLSVPVSDVDTLWWGHMSNAGKRGAAAIPIRPDLMLDVLAVGVLHEDSALPPYAVMRFDGQADAYVIDSIAPAANRMELQKEVYYDRQSLEPRRVLLFDGSGRVVLRATLGDFTSLNGARMAGRFDLQFPESGSTMRFMLSDMALSKNGVPRAGTIHLPDLDNPGVKKVIEIDKP